MKAVFQDQTTTLPLTAQMPSDLGHLAYLDGMLALGANKQHHLTVLSSKLKP